MWNTSVMHVIAKCKRLARIVSPYIYAPNSLINLKLVEMNMGLLYMNFSLTVGQIASGLKIPHLEHLCHYGLNVIDRKLS